MDTRTTLPLAQPIRKAKRPSTNADRDAPRARTLALALAAALGLASATGIAAASDFGDAAPAQPRSGVLRSVTNCNDAGAGSLRAAAALALDGDGIDLTALTCSTISVTSGSIPLRDVELIGPGASRLTIDGGGNQPRRTFNHVGHGGGLTIRDVTVRGAKYQSNAGQGGACLRSDSGPLRIYDSVFRDCLAFAPTGTNGAVRGGAIAAYGNSAKLINVTLTNNQARSANGAALGGALYAFGKDLLIGRSTISNNSATKSGTSTLVRGGGVFAHGSATISISTIDGNLSEGKGGGAFVEGGGQMLFSTVSNNVSVGGASGIAFLGNGGYSTPYASIVASTIHGNETQASTETGTGALYLNTMDASINGCTITSNVESNVQDIAFGAGILFGPVSAQGIPTLVGTIVYDNHIANHPIGADIGGPLGSSFRGDHNLVGISYVQYPADTLHLVDPLLGPLQDNGGATWTRMPAANSPVIDRGNGYGQAYDQREYPYPRVVGAAADIGAVEAPSDVIFANGFDP